MARDADHVWGGTGADLEHGEDGVDQVFGNAGNDTAYGGTSTDVIEGNNGPDWVSGGADNDTSTAAPARPGVRTPTPPGRAGAAKGDDLYGDIGDDVLIGDNGTETDPYPFDLDGADADAGAATASTAEARTTGVRRPGRRQRQRQRQRRLPRGQQRRGHRPRRRGRGPDRRRFVPAGDQRRRPAGRRRLPVRRRGPDLITGDNAMLLVVAEAQATRVTRAAGSPPDLPGDAARPRLSPAGGTPATT